MNIQDIADFIELVKNPAKYERVLQNIKDEQGRLNAAIETVGKASDLDKLRKDVEVRIETITSDYAKKTDELEKAYAKKEKRIENLCVDLEGKITLAQTQTNAADVRQKAAEDLANSFAGRDKKLKEQEKFVADLQVEVQKQAAEYNEKLEKLRSIGII